MEIEADTKLPRVAIAIGDPYSGNTELVLSAISDIDISEKGTLILVGDFNIIQQKAKSLRMRKSVKRIDLTSFNSEEGKLFVIDKPKHPITPQLSDLKQKAGERIVVDLESALQAALMGYVDCVAVAPVNMSAVRSAGFGYDDLSMLFREWIRLADDFELVQMENSPNVKLVTNLPFIATIASPTGERDKRHRDTYLLDVMKETINLAIELKKANNTS